MRAPSLLHGHGLVLRAARFAVDETGADMGTHDDSGCDGITGVGGRSVFTPLLLGQDCLCHQERVQTAANPKKHVSWCRALVPLHCARHLSQGRKVDVRCPR